MVIRLSSLTIDEAAKRGADWPFVRAAHVRRILPLLFSFKVNN